MMKPDLLMLPDHSRVWIYQSNRPLTDDETALIHSRLSEFCGEWNAHGAQLKAAFDIRYHLFVILAVDENVNAVSGCSIDKSVALIKSLGDRLGCDFLDRKVMAFRNDRGEIELQDINQFWALRKAGIITPDSIVFNNLVASVGELRTGWEVPFARSWHAEMFS